MQQQFIIQDIQRTLLSDGSGVAAVTLVPAQPAEPGTGMPPTPYGTGTTNPSSLRVTGMPVADVVGWDIGRATTLTLS